jgi:excisionase family DNA binding protein
LDTDTTPRNLRVLGAATYSGLSRTRLYEAIRSGELDSIKVGARRLIPRAALDAYLDKLETSDSTVDA